MPRPMPLTARSTSSPRRLTNRDCAACYATKSPIATDRIKQRLESKRTFEFINRLTANPHSRLAATFGLHASLTLSGATLQACRAAVPEGTGFHIHAAKSDADEWDSINKSGMRVIDRLQQHEILGPKTIAAHCVHIDASEMEILADTGTWVSHQPRSNMNSAVGSRLLNR